MPVNKTYNTLAGAGLGLRRSLMPAMLASENACLTDKPDFLELAPENWIGLGGRFARDLSQFTSEFPTVCHGLSLSLGGPAPLDQVLIGKIREFLNQHQVLVYSEHLSYTGDQGHLYDLLPLPMTEESVDHVAQRIIQTQDLLGRQIAIENVSTYARPFAEMSESEFVQEVICRSDCLLLLDINNVYVNSVNHKFDPKKYILSMPQDRISYLHVAGHYQQAPDLLIDTHGSEVCREVLDLLQFTYDVLGPVPTLLERDFNVPPLKDLYAELVKIRQLQLCGEHTHEPA
ncbi:MAG: DUF692 domain-containing protein [Moraxellaceae bacterium]|nr:DUF692 domain-containing protein [Moraxellaceae bacterium]